LARVALVPQVLEPFEYGTNLRASGAPGEAGDFVAVVPLASVGEG
jgi:hypothetical protein